MYIDAHTGEINTYSSIGCFVIINYNNTFLQPNKNDFCWSVTIIHSILNTIIDKGVSVIVLLFVCNLCYYHLRMIGI